MKKPKRNSYCYAPGCKTGYPRQKNAPKLSLFGVPSEKQLLQEWQRNLRRCDRPLDATSAVCELHFEPQLIIRDYVHVIDGKEVRTPRGRPTLAAGAVPTILPNLPERLSKRFSTKRSERKRPFDARPPTTKTPVKRRACDVERVQGNIVDETPSTEMCDAANEVHLSRGVGLDYILPLDMNTPSMFWTRQLLPNVPGIVYSIGSLVSETHVDILTEKLVVVSTDQCTDSSGAIGKVYLKGKLHFERKLKTRGEAETLLAEVDKLNLCKGALEVDDLATSVLTSSMCEQVTVLGGVYFSKKCNGSSPNKGGEI